MRLSQYHHHHHSQKHLLIALPLLLLVSLFLTAAGAADAPEDVSEQVDCGCPNTCTVEARQETNTADWPCGERIVYLMNHYKFSEKKACTWASKYPDMPDVIGNVRPCRYQTCHPQGCGSSLLPTKPTTTEEEETETAEEATTLSKEEEEAEEATPNICGCPNTCTDAVLQETKNGMPDSCQSRLDFLQDQDHFEAFEACTISAEEGYCDYDACHPVACGSNLELPGNYRTGSTTTGSPRSLWGALLLVGSVMIAFAIVWRGNRQNAASFQRRQATDDVFDHVHPEQFNDERDETIEFDPAELSSHPRPYPYRDSSTQLKVPPTEMWESVRSTQEATETQLIQMG